MKTISRYIMTLALLLTAVTGAWAADTYTITFSANGKNKTYTDVALPAQYKCEYGTPGELDKIIQELYEQDGGHAISNATPTVTGTDAITPGLDGPDAFAKITIIAPFTGKATVSGTYAGWSNNSGNSDINYSIEVYFGTPSSDDALTVEWNASTKTGTFAMPGSDVVLTPIYAKAAAFATTGTEPDVKTLLPEAAEGVIADTDAPLIKEGTGIVAFAAASTTATQGTLMYAVTPATVTEAPAFDAANKWSADVPTAKTVADGGIDVLVWYYIKGADAPDGEAATLDNTFNDTEPACLTVQVLTNKFDIQFNAANANTIEAGKATVTLDGTAATVTEGKLQGVKMGSEVKLEAKPGYKFRKVEVKKGGAGRPAAEATADDKGKLIGADGNIYDDAAAATAAGTTAVAKIIYLGSETGDATYTHGLALALADEGEMTWETAVGTCSGKNTSAAVPGASWMLPSQVQWNKMISAAGSYTALRDGFSSVDGTNMSSYYYWSSTEIDSSRVNYIYFGNGNWGGGNKGYSDVRTRACIVF